MQQNIKDHYAYLKEQIEAIRETAQERIDPKYLKDYEKFALAIEKLVEATDPLLETDESGKLPEISLEKRDELLKLYEAVGTASIVVDDRRELSTHERYLSTLSRRIGALVSQDINALTLLKAPATFADIIEKGRRKVIDITGKETSKVGANLSSRTVIEKENGEKAVFTKETKFDPSAALQQHITKYCDKYPEYSDVFNVLNNGPCFTEMSIYRQLPMKDGKPEFEIEGTYMRLKCPVIYRSLVANPRVNGKFYQLQRQPGFSEIMYSFFRDSSNVALNVSINGAQLGVEKNNENIDDRNVGMSIVAGLLGIDNVIAHSENVVIKNGEEEINGTVMDFAKGKDINKIALDDSMRKMKNPEATPETLKAISDLEILDFICGNVDRHGANLFYSIDDSDPTNIKLNGIVGIDNDASFGILKDDEVNYGANRMTGIEDIRFIDEITANKVMGLTPGMLKIALQGTTINKKAVENACYRLTKLQDKITNAYHMKKDKTNCKKNKLNIVSKENWEKTDLETLANIANDTTRSGSKDTYFSRIYTTIRSTRELKYDLKNKEETIFNKNAELNDAIRPVNEMVQTSAAEVKSGIWRFRGSSKQYNDIQKESIELGKKAAKVSINSTEAELVAFVEDLKTTKDHVRAYLDRKELEQHPTDPKKKPKKFGKYTKNRIAIMQKFYDRLSSKEDNLRTLMAEKNQLVTEKQSIVDAINQAKLAASPKLQKKLQNDLNKGAKNISQNVVVNNNPVINEPKKAK